MSAAALRRAAAARRAGRAAVLEGADGAGADRRRRARRARLRARAPDRARPRRARRAVDRPRAARGARRARCSATRRGRTVVGGCGATRRCTRSTCRSSLLVGGATGTGKSTVATEAAHRLGITRVTSTDFIRQTMRAFFSRGVHAVDPLLELRGRARRSPTPRPATRRCSASSSRRATCSSASSARDRARADRGLVDGARGRPPRAGDGAARRSRARSSSTSCSRSTDEDVHRDALPRPRRATAGVRAMDKYLDAARRHPPDPELHRRARRRERDVPVIENVEPRARDRRGDGARASPSATGDVMETGERQPERPRRHRGGPASARRTRA